MRSTAIVIVAVAGLLVALAALLDPRGGGVTLPHVRVTFTVPEFLLVSTGAVFVIAWLLIMVASRARRKPDSGPDASGGTSWRQAIAPMIAMLPLIAIVVILWLDGGRLAGALLALGQGWFGAPSATDGAPEPIVLSLPWLGWGVGLLGLAVALATLAIAVLLLFGDRLIGWWLARQTRQQRAEIAAAVDESLDDLDDGADPRIAIINCYRRFEGVAARAEVRRAPWQTPEEFMRETLGRLALPVRAVERLTRLFEVARFSDHPLDALERDRARACLEEIRRSIDASENAVAVA